jgi:large subunit ribosomal protein L13
VDAPTLLQKDPERILEEAIHGMLPRTTQGRAQRRRLHVYKGANHPHAAQRPQLVESGAIGVG